MIMRVTLSQKVGGVLVVSFDDAGWLTILMVAATAAQTSLCMYVFQVSQLSVHQQCLAESVKQKIYNYYLSTFSMRGPVRRLMVIMRRSFSEGGVIFPLLRVYVQGRVAAPWRNNHRSTAPTTYIIRTTTRGQKQTGSHARSQFALILRSIFVVIMVARQ